MKYKIVFSDIDGTLLNKERELSPLTIQTIKEVKPFLKKNLKKTKRKTSIGAAKK